MLGICNGFQILCEAGLLPGVLRANRQVEFVCADVTVTVESTATPFTRSCTSRGRPRHPDQARRGQLGRGRRARTPRSRRGARSCSATTEDVNGSRDRVAGVANVDGNVLGLMPHPEHAVDPVLGPTGGAVLLEGLDRSGPRPGRWRRGLSDTAAPSARTIWRRSSHPPSPRAAAAPARSCGRAREQDTELGDVSLAERHRPAPRRAARRVREPHESLGSVRLEELDARREPLVSGPLWQRELLQARRLAPGCRHRRHGRQRSAQV